MELAGKFEMFQNILTGASRDWLVREAVRKSTLEDWRYIFQTISADDLQEFIKLASDKEQYEICSHLKALAEDR